MTTEQAPPTAPDNERMLVRFIAALTVSAAFAFPTTAAAQSGECDSSKPPPEVTSFIAAPHSPSNDGRLVVVTNENIAYDLYSRDIPGFIGGHPCASTFRFEWDLDGDGSFETDTGSNPRGIANYPTPGRITVSVRVSNANGSSLGSVPVEIRQAPPPGQIGISINEGAQFTNDPKVELSVVWGKYASETLVSNDGGFAAAASRAFPVAERLTWTLQSSGPERLPKTVYARFCAEGMLDYNCHPQSFTDDIILDETAPILSSVAVDAGGSKRAAGALVTIKAKDATSGVESMQLTRKKSKPGAWKDFANQVRFRGKASKLFARVQDAAGNPSVWVRAEVKK